MSEDDEIHAEVTEGVLLSLEQARNEAVALGHGYIGTEHVVIVLSGAQGSRGAANMRDQGVDSERLRIETRKIFEENSWTPYMPVKDVLSTVGVDLDAVRQEAEAEFGPGVVPMETPDPGFTRRMIKILEAASAHAAEGGGQKADVDDVLAALIDDGDSVGMKVLQRAGIDVVALRSSLQGRVR